MFAKTVGCLSLKEGIHEKVISLFPFFFLYTKTENTEGTHWVLLKVEEG